MWQRYLALLGIFGLAMAGCDVATAPGTDEAGNSADSKMFEGLESIGGPDDEPAAAPSDNPNPPIRLREVHRRGTFQFVTSPGFGGERMPRSVRGPHNDSRQWIPPFGIKDRPELAAPEQFWAVKSVTLIGMMHNPEGQAYKQNTLAMVPKGPPGADKIKAMDEFEQTALRGVKKGHEILVDTRTPGTIRMMGALYATAECTKCHAVKEGTLLGALSYTLEPTKAPVAQPVP